MKAIVIARPGPPAVLELHDRPLPVPRSGEVLVRVHAAGVNRPDIAQRKGHYPPPSWASQDIPGLEIAGTIESTGKGAIRWKVGDRVCALVVGGGYSEYCLVPAGHCLPIPDTLTFNEAASLPETVFTVWSNVFERGKLVTGESLLVHGGSSGIGVTAIQIAKALGSDVYCTAGTDEKCNFCESLGATKAINYKTSNFKEVLLQATNGKGVNVVLDMVGGSYTADNLDCLAIEGRLVLINFMKGEESALKLGPILKKRLTITGSMLRSRDDVFKAELAAAVEKNVWPLIESGRVRPVINKVFPLASAAKAHALMESGTHTGKIVLEVIKE